jgi:hypothetical protein
MKGTARLSEVLPHRRPIRIPAGLSGLLRSATARTIRLAITAVAAAWLPAIILAAFHGLGSLRSFLIDYAAQSRLLIVIPLLIIAEPPMVASLQTIAHHFRDEGLVKEEEIPRFDSALSAFTRWGDRPIVRIVMTVMVYLFVASTISIVTSSSLMPWCFGAGGILNLSPAGSWYVLVSLPITLLILLRWVWRQLVWLWFLTVTSRMDLQLIPSHPDLTGGLGFLEQCMRGYWAFGFAIGTLVAGGVANRVVYLSQPITAFRYTPLFVIAIVLILCAGPLCVFWGTLFRTRRRGIFEYGALATRMGRQFEHKWLVPSKEDGSALEVQDFSATIDLYSVVTNVHEMHSVPVGMRSVGRLAGAALAPAVPLALVALPFDVIMEHVIKLLL